MSLHCTSSPLKVPLQLHCRMHVPLLKYEEDSHQQALRQIPHRLRRQGQSDSYDSAYVLLRGRWETLCKEAGESDHRGWGGGGGGGGGDTSGSAKFSVMTRSMARFMRVWIGNR
ncbi:hypothetical protein HBH74_205160 [Parastagonospora nodorum]|nr:hypothetical protein HBH74_205160 [Parastagonospora nodorum]